MEFHPVYVLAAKKLQIAHGLSRLVSKYSPAAFLATTPPVEPPKPDPNLPKGAQALAETSQNLLKHIPGEASGFYLLAVDSIDKPNLRTLGLIFGLALVLLIVVRLVAKAS